MEIGCGGGKVLATLAPYFNEVIGAMHILAGLSRPGNEGFTPDPRQTVLFDAGHLHYFTFRWVKMFYRLAGFRPEQHIGIASQCSRLCNFRPMLLSSSVCISAAFEEMEG